MAAAATTAAATAATTTAAAATVAVAASTTTSGAFTRARLSCVAEARAADAGPATEATGADAATFAAEHGASDYCCIRTATTVPTT